MLENLSLYRAFYAAAQCRSFSEAAQRLYIGQPAVSASIQHLEEQLGTALFYRSSRGITLTPQGQILLSYVSKAFSYLESGEDKLRDVLGLRDGVLRIGASDMTLRFYLLHYLQAFHAVYPGVRLQVTNAPTPDTLTALRDGQIDFGVVSGPPSYSAPDSEQEHVCFYPVRAVQDIFICAKNDQVDIPRPVTRAVLRRLPLILLESHTSTRRYLDQWFSEDGAMPVPEIELATSDLILEFVRRGIGVGCIVEDFAKDALMMGEVCQIPVTPPLPPRQFYLVTSVQTGLSTAAHAFLQTAGIPVDGG